MFSPELVQLSILVMSAVAVGGVVYVLAMPYLSGEKKTTKRLKAVSSNEGRNARRASAANAVNQQARRRQVQENLKELEEKKKAKKNKMSLRVKLLRAGLNMTTNTFYIISAITGMACFAAVLLSGSTLPVAGLAALVGAVGLPRWFLGMLIKRRQAKFLEEFPNALDMIIRGVKSGLPLNDCINIISNESAEPVKSEFADIVEQQRVGVSLTQALDKMNERMELSEVNFFTIVIAIQQQAGGNLAEALSNLSLVLRDRKKLRGKVKSFSAEAKSSAAIIGSLPFIVMLLVYITTPGYLSVLWTEKTGQFMLVFSGCWMLCGILVMRKMINFDY